MPGLSAVVRELYSVFSRYPLREPLSYCDHCMAPADAAALATTPLREISAGLMRSHPWDAMAETWGDWDDLKHFLPRLLELLGTGELREFSLFEILFSHLAARARDWPADERAALAGYLHALWEHHWTHLIAMTTLARTLTASPRRRSSTQPRAWASHSTGNRLHTRTFPGIHHMARNSGKTRTPTGSTR